MTVVFISNYYNHHQSPFSENMDRLTGGNYYFIATQPMEKERKNMGWNVTTFPTFVKFQYKNEQTKKRCQEIIDNADVAIIGSAPNDLIRNRLKQKKLTFRYSERPYKQKPEWYRMVYHIFKNYWRSGRFKNLYMLCASAYTASDYNKVLSFRNKCFKWGYFTQIKHYDNIRNLIKLKHHASILWVARLIELKHPDASIQIIKRLKEAGYDAQLSIIGTGPLKNELEALIKTYNLQNEVRLLGSMTPEEVRIYMEQSEIFLFTSDKKEGWGAVLNESMNSGCAVVSSHKIGSTPFLIKDGENGFIYKDGDLNDLYEKTKWLLDHKSKRETMGEKAYETMVNMWNAENASKRLLKLIDVLQKGQDTPFTEGPCSRAEMLYDNWK